MSIINRIDFSRDYTQMPNAWLRDNRLSYRARGVLAEIMANRDGWDTSVEHGPEGREAIRAAIKELVEHGYLEREVIVKEGGEESAS